MSVTLEYICFYEDVLALITQYRGCRIVQTALDDRAHT